MKRITYTLVALAACAVIAPAQSLNIFPVLNCVDYDPVAATLTAHFGYDNLETSSAFIPFGVTNFFSPPPGVRGQPVNFSVGAFNDVFTVTFSSGTTLTWTLIGRQVTASGSSALCGNPVLLPPATAGVPYSYRLAAVGSSSLLFAAGANFPPGLTVSPDGVISGTVSTAGVYQATVTLNGTVSKTYLLQVMAQPVFDDKSNAVRMRLPAIRTVTSASSGVNATASCNDNETLISGGGACAVTGSNTIAGRIATSQPSGNGWQVACNNGLATAVAVCAAK